MNDYFVAAIWIAMALAASLISIRIGVSVALVEILVGALLGNIPGVRNYVEQTSFTAFLATLGSVLLTFLAGAEIDPVSLRRHWRASLSIGVISFTLPFAGAFGFSLLILHWQLHAAEICGVALSTTSVAVVYAVMVETGLSQQDLGKLILAACFVTDLGTVLALGGLFASYGALLVAFIAVSAVVLALLPRMTRLLIDRVGHRVSEPEIKFLLLVLFGLGGLASAAGSEAVLPAYVAGLVVAGVFLNDRVLIDRMRAIAFALLTPFFFLRAGLLISVSAIGAGAGAIGVLFAVKMVTKVVGVWPMAAAFGVELGGRAAALTLRKDCLQRLTTPRADGDLTAIRSDRDLGSGGTTPFDTALTRGCRVSPVISTPYTRQVLLPADKMIREPLDRLDRLAGELAGRAVIDHSGRGIFNVTQGRAGGSQERLGLLGCLGFSVRPLLSGSIVVHTGKCAPLQRHRIGRSHAAVRAKIGGRAGAGGRPARLHRPEMRSMNHTTITEAKLRAAVDFLTALGAAGRVLDTAELRVEALSAGIAQAALWAAVHRLGGVPGWGSAAPRADLAR